MNLPAPLEKLSTYDRNRRSQKQNKNEQQAQGRDARKNDGYILIHIRPNRNVARR